MAARRTATRKKTAPRKTSARKTTRRTTRSKPAAPSFKIPRAEGPRTKSQVFGVIAENTELTRKQVSMVFDCAKEIIAKDLKRGGPEAVNLGGLMKVTVKRKPAQPKRKGINPFTGVEQWFKAKPATNQVKIRPLKSLKDAV